MDCKWKYISTKQVLFILSKIYEYNKCHWYNLFCNNNVYWQNTLKLNITQSLVVQSDNTNIRSRHNTSTAQPSPSLDIICNVEGLRVPDLFIDLCQCKRSLPPGSPNSREGLRIVSTICVCHNTCFDQKKIQRNVVYNQFYTKW